MTHKHTPGPWFWNEQDQLVSSVLVKAIDDLEPDHHPVIVETDSGVYPPEGADRLLIAAAPELLEALKVCYDLGIDSNCVAMVKAAIAKATGSAE